MKQSDQNIKLAVCEMCHSRCQVTAHSNNGRLVKIEKADSDPLKDSIFPPTNACLRLLSAKDWLYHPDHLKYPLKRTGEKGEGKWEQISWDQAFDEISSKMKSIKEKYGPESIAGTRGTQRTNEEFIARFFNGLGSPNCAGQSNICYSPCCVTAKAMCGWTPRHRSTVFPEWAEERGAGSLFMIGINPAQAVHRLWKLMRDSKKAGVKIIVADPRRTESAELADVWLQLRPGSDTALLLAMIHVIIEEGLYDRDFVHNWCHGFEEVSERVRKYSPERVAEITWLKPEDIRIAARMYAQHKPAFALNGMGEEQLSNSSEAMQAKMILIAITGNLDINGGNIIPGPAEIIDCAEMSLSDVISPEQKAKQIGSDRFKLLAWPGWDLMEKYTKRIWGKACGQPSCDVVAHFPSLLRTMITGKPYPVKACLTIASNPMVTQANTKLVYKALKNLDLYVVADFWMTPSAALADYVLPSASWLERPFLYSQGGAIDRPIRGGDQALPSTIPGEYDRRNDFEIFREISIRLGLKKYWPWESLEESYDYRLSPMGITFQEFLDKGGNHFPPVEEKKYKKIGFATPTGKVELYSTIFKELGYDPLPEYEESHENILSKPELAKEYPLMLITGGRFRWMYHSEHRQVDKIRRKHPDPLVQVHPDTAKEHGIFEGDWIWIESPRGRIRMKCKHFDGLDPRVIHAEHGWWFPELPGEEPWLHGVWESNINVLMDDDPDVCNKITGVWPLKTALCKIYKCKAY